MLLSDLIPGPHPEPAAEAAPANWDMMLAVAVLGWLPDSRWEPVVRA